jgi:Spermine/spermidine synthase domain
VNQTMVASSPRTSFWSWFRVSTEKHLFVNNPRLRIFLVSFAMLFFELLCIRWIPSYVRYLSYFNNFILMASFLGIGLGMLAARRKRFWFPPFPLMLLILAIVVAKNRFNLQIDSTQVLYYGAGEAQSAQAENFIVLPIIFGLVTLCFIPLGRAFGQLITEVQPLTAYTFDIIGSLLGIACFSIMAYFAFPPAIWFALLIIPLLLLTSRRTIVPAALLLLISLSIAWQLQIGAFWSPYYKILLHPAAPKGYLVDVNNAGGHQEMVPWQYKEPFYRFVYQTFPGKSFHNALILGAGSGSDVSTALAYGVQSITAVEIDPTILQLGVRYNPDHPYSNPRVKMVVNDGRAFLQNTTGRYDLIIFALPDSLTLTSSNTSLRLESFLLTQNALETARAHLTKNGVVVLYNYYRDQWLIQKLVDMVGHAFNQQPLVSTYGGWGRAAVIMAGPRLATLPPSKFGPYHETPSAGNQRLRVLGTGYYPLSNSTPATDDWPFLYLRDRSFPLIYIEALAMVIFFALAGTVTLAPRRVLRRFNWHMFFLGVAFMVLEVKSLTTFSLLFGSTWLVNSLVFFAILCSVLLAVLVNRRFKIRRIRVFYLLLFGILLLNLLLPPEALLLNNTVLRYLMASAMAFTPVFLANIIFTNSFRNSEASDIAFASNLLGIMVGGGLEYFSMLFGYRWLLLLVILFYACALLLWRRQNASEEVPELSLSS